MKVDLHIHTCYSHDNFTPLEKTIEAVQKSGVDCVAVTDHNEVRGAFELQKRAPFRVIIGEEIKSSEGEIIGLFLKERIPPKLSARETITRIREQGGLVMIPHPFLWIFASRLKRKLVYEFVREELVDAIEVYNASGISMMSYKKVYDLLRGKDIARVSVTDAHFAYEFVGACVKMKDFSGSRDFLEKLKKGQLVMKPGYLHSSFQQLYNFVKRKLFQIPKGVEDKLGGNTKNIIL